MTEKSNELDTNNAISPLGVAKGRRNSDSNMNLRAMGDQSVIQYAGKTGIFVPITKDNKAEDKESKQNLMEVIDVLRQRIKDIEQENNELKIQLKKATEKIAHTPDDFVTAISHSVDSLQSKLANMDNPTSNFVVRDFSIDTKVFIDVTPLGTIDYRFIQPGDDTDPKHLSNISLSLAPTPKPDNIGSYTTNDFTPFEDIDEVQGIGHVYKSKLKEKNIFTVSDLLHAGTRIRSKVELAAMLEVDHRKLGEWLSHARLLTVKSINGHAAEVLFDIGIDSLNALAVQQAETLCATYNARVEAVNHKVLSPISVETATSWVKAAQTYTGEKPVQQSENMTSGEPA